MLVSLIFALVTRTILYCSMGRIRPLVVFTSLKVFVVKIYDVIFGSYVLLAEIQAFWRRRIDWLWPYQIPRGCGCAESG